MGGCVSNVNNQVPDNQLQTPEYSKDVLSQFSDIINRKGEKNSTIATTTTTTSSCWNKTSKIHNYNNKQIINNTENNFKITLTPTPKIKEKTIIATPPKSPLLSRAEKIAMLKKQFFENSSIAIAPMETKKNPFLLKTDDLKCKNKINQEEEEEKKDKIKTVMTTKIPVLKDAKKVKKKKVNFHGDETVSKIPIPTLTTTNNSSSHIPIVTNTSQKLPKIIATVKPLIMNKPKNIIKPLLTPKTTIATTTTPIVKKPPHPSPFYTRFLGDYTKNEQFNNSSILATTTSSSSSSSVYLIDDEISDQPELTFFNNGCYYGDESKSFNEGSLTSIPSICSSNEEFFNNHLATTEENNIHQRNTVAMDYNRNSSSFISNNAAIAANASSDEFLITEIKSLKTSLQILQQLLTQQEKRERAKDLLIQQLMGDSCHVFGVKEKSFEEAIAEQKKYSEALLGKTVGKKVKVKKEVRIVNKKKKKVSEELFVVAKEKHVEIVDEPEIISGGDLNDEEVVLISRRHSLITQSTPPPPPPKSILINKDQQQQQQQQKVSLETTEEDSSSSSTEELNNFSETLPKDFVEFKQLQSQQQEQKQQEKQQQPIQQQQQPEKPTTTVTPPQKQSPTKTAPPTAPPTTTTTSTTPPSPPSSPPNNCNKQKQSLPQQILDSHLTLEQTQSLIELLLNKNSQLKEWNSTSKKESLIKKQLTEREKQLSELETNNISLQNKLKEIRVDFNGEKNNLLKKLNSFENLLSKKEGEISNLKMLIQMGELGKNEGEKVRRAEGEAWRGRVDVLEREIGALKVQYNKQGTQLNTAFSSNEELTKKVFTLQQNLNLQEMQLQHSNNSMNKIINEKERELRAEVNALAEEREKLIQDLNAMGIKLKEKEEIIILKQKAEENNDQELRNNLNQLKNNEINLKNVIDNLKLEFDVVNGDLEGVKGRNEELRSKNAKLTETLKQTEKNLENKIAALESEIDNCLVSMGVQSLGELVAAAAAAGINKKEDEKERENENELKELNLKLKEEVDHYQHVLVGTETLLATLQSSIEAEEQKWQLKLDEKEREIQKLQLLNSSSRSSDDNNGINNSLESLQSTNSLKINLESSSPSSPVVNEENKVTKKKKILGGLFSSSKN